MAGMVTKHVRAGEPGFVEKCKSAHLYCNDVAPDQRTRCTRGIRHPLPHAAHIVQGIPDAYEMRFDPDTGESVGLSPKPGMKTSEVIQVATW